VDRSGYFDALFGYGSVNAGKRVNYTAVALENR